MDKKLYGKKARAAPAEDKRKIERKAVEAFCRDEQEGE